MTWSKGTGRWLMEPMRRYSMYARCQMRSKFVGLFELMKNWKFSAQLVLWASPSMESAVRGGNAVTGGHQLGDLLLLRLLFEPLHGVEDAAGEALDDGHMVAGESARANQTSAINRLASCVVTSMRLPLTFERL